MLSRRGFMTAGACAAAATSTGLAAGGGVSLLAGLDSVSHTPMSKLGALTYERFSTLEQSWFRLVNDVNEFDAQILSVQDLNTDSRLEQFEVLMQGPADGTDYSGVYHAYHQSDKQLRSQLISLVQADDWQRSGRYVAVFSTFRQG